MRILNEKIFNTIGNNCTGCYYWYLELTTMLQQQRKQLLLDIFQPVWILLFLWQMTLGMFKKEGLKVQLVPFRTGSELIDAANKNQIDVGYVGITPVTSAIDQNSSIKIVAAVNTRRKWNCCFK